MKKTHLFLPMIIMIVSTAISCATIPVQINASWVRPDYKPKKFNKVLVVSDMKIITNRQLVEKKIAGLLEKNGINAIVGLTVIPPGEKKPGKEAFIKKMKEMNIDGVIMVTLVDVKNEPAKTVEKDKKASVEHDEGVAWNFGFFYDGGYPGFIGDPGYYGPGYYASFSTHYSITKYDISYDPRWTDTTKRVIVATHFYEIGKDKLVWAAQSTMANVDQAKIEIFIDSFSKALVNKLIGMKLIGF
jgi:hypothetical protein